MTPSHYLQNNGSVDDSNNTVNVLPDNFQNHKDDNGNVGDGNAKVGMIYHDSIEDVNDNVIHTCTRYHNNRFSARND